jgi:hypothetical protein
MTESLLFPPIFPEFVTLKSYSATENFGFVTFLRPPQCNYHSCNVS